MRTIKFRIFNKKIKSYIDIHSSAIMIDELNELNDHLIVEQFTGLHDKNGKEIFEGDKLQNPKKEVGEVVFWESGFRLEAKRRNNSIFYMPLNNGFLQNKEIIGNVFENTDLVKL